MRRTFTLAACWLAVSFMLTTNVAARTFVSLNGKFYIEYPDNWKQVDYNMVDMFLARSQAGQSMYEYEAAFAPDSSEPFFAGDYLMLTVESHDSLSDKQIDSILAELGRSFGKSIRSVSPGSSLADLRRDDPVYDKATHTVSILSDMVVGDGNVNKNLLVMKFYNQGIASFYFYSPDSLYNRSRQTFMNIVSSFRTENFADKLPKQDLKVANLNTETSGGNGDTGGKSPVLYLSMAVLALVIIFVVIRLRKKRS